MHHLVCLGKDILMKPLPTLDCEIKEIETMLKEKIHSHIFVYTDEFKENNNVGYFLGLVDYILSASVDIWPL